MSPLEPRIPPAPQVERRAYEIQLHNLPEPAAITVDGHRIPRRAARAPGWTWGRTKSVATIRLTKHSIRTPIRVTIASAR